MPFAIPVRPRVRTVRHAYFVLKFGVILKLTMFEGPTICRATHQLGTSISRVFQVRGTAVLGDVFPYSPVKNVHVGLIILQVFSLFVFDLLGRRMFKESRIEDDVALTAKATTVPTNQVVVEGIDISETSTKCKVL